MKGYIYILIFILIYLVFKSNFIYEGFTIVQDKIGISTNLFLTNKCPKPNPPPNPAPNPAPSPSPNPTPSPTAPRGYYFPEVRDPRDTPSVDIGLYCYSAKPWIPWSSQQELRIRCKTGSGGTKERYQKMKYDYLCKIATDSGDDICNKRT
jgi:hypothetical protein